MIKFLHYCFVAFLLFSTTSCANIFEKEKQKIEGGRIPIGDLEQKLNITVSSSSLHVNPVSKTNSSWQYLTAFGGKENFHLPENLYLQKKFKVSRSGVLPIISYPIVLNESLILMGKNGTIYNYNTNKGKINWVNKTFFSKKIKISRDYLNGGLSYEKDKLFATSGNNKVICIDLNTGNVLWMAQLQSMTRSVPYITSDKLIIQTLDNGVYALDKETGKVLWHNIGINDGISILYSVTPIVYENYVILQSNSFQPHYLDINNGNEEQIFQNNDFLKSTFHLDLKKDNNVKIYQPVLDKQILFFYDEKGDFYAINLKFNNMIWKKKYHVNVPFLINGNIIFAINEQNQLLFIDKYNGDLVFILDLNQYLDEKSNSKVFWSTPVIANSTIKVSNSVGKLLTFDTETKKLLNTLEIPKDTYIPPVIANDCMYIVSSRGEALKYGEKNR